MLAISPRILLRSASNLASSVRVPCGRGFYVILFYFIFLESYVALIKNRDQAKPAAASHYITISANTLREVSSGDPINQVIEEHSYLVFVLCLV